jgi:hypothetical protein
MIQVMPSNMPLTISEGDVNCADFGKWLLSRWLKRDVRRWLLDVQFPMLDTQHANPHSNTGGLSIEFQDLYTQSFGIVLDDVRALRDIDEGQAQAAAQQLIQRLCQELVNAVDQFGIDTTIYVANGGVNSIPNGPNLTDQNQRTLRRRDSWRNLLNSSPEPGESGTPLPGIVRTRIEGLIAVVNCMENAQSNNVCDVERFYERSGVYRSGFSGQETPLNSAGTSYYYVALIYNASLGDRAVRERGAPERGRARERRREQQQRSTGCGCSTAGSGQPSPTIRLLLGLLEVVGVID